MVKKELPTDGVRVGQRARKADISLAQARGYLLQAIRLLARAEGSPARWIRTGMRLSTREKRNRSRSQLRFQIFIKDVSSESVSALLQAMSDVTSEGSSKGHEHLDIV